MILTNAGTATPTTLRLWLHFVGAHSASVIFHGVFMSSYISQVFNVILVFLLTLVMNSALEFFTAESGTIRKGEVISIGPESFLPLEIENYKSEYINDLQILVPKGLDVGEVISSKPLVIEKIDSTSSSDEFNLFSFSSIMGRGVTRILVPLKYVDSECCEFLNEKALNLEVKTDGEVVNPIRSAVIKGVQTAGIYSIFILAFALWMNSRTKELKQDIKDLSERLDSTMKESSKESERFRENLIEIKKLYKRQQTFLLRRVNDYAKEVDFWRNTLRKILFEYGSDKHAVQKMLRKISEAIGTSSTHGNTKHEYEDFESLSDVILSIDESHRTKI